MFYKWVQSRFYKSSPVQVLQHAQKIELWLQKIALLFGINCTEINQSQSSNILCILLVEINVPQGQNIVVGVIYRPPNQNTEVFVDEWNDILINITRGNKLCYIMGDFNLDLLS
jgi:hypothetical protein